MSEETQSPEESKTKSPFGPELTEILQALFGELKHQGASSSPKEQRESKEKVEYIFYNPGTIRKTLRMYCSGCSIDSISVMLGLPDEDVNKIIDHFAPHMEF